MISFSSISFVFKKFQKPSNLITYLITGSFKITKKIIQTAKSNHFIGHDTFFLHTKYKPIQCPLYSNTSTNIKTLVWIGICDVCAIRSFFFQTYLPHSFSIPTYMYLMVPLYLQYLFSRIIKYQ
jgi:hypothetical protein